MGRTPTGVSRVLSLLAVGLGCVVALPVSRADHVPGLTDHRTRGDLKDIVSNLYGGDGIRLSEASGFGHDAHFTAQSLQGLDALNEALAGGVGFLSFNSIVTGFTLDVETGIPVRSTDSLGPLIAESPHTLGQGKLNLGFSYTNQKFTHFEGRRLNNQRIELLHDDSNGDGVLAPFQPFPGGPVLDFELDSVVIDIEIELEQHILALFANYGLTEKWDVGIVVPIVHVKAEANAVGRIVDPTPGTPSPHFFDAATGDSAVSQTGGSATGIGDILLRTKHTVLTEHAFLPDTALGAQVVLPTGDADDLLGSGETRIQAVLIMAKQFGPWQPHANLGYEYVPGDHQLNSVRYIVGVDVTPIPELTLAVDVLGRWEHSGDGIGDHLVDLALGSKMVLKDTLLLNFNLLFPLNRNEGLRAAVTWTVGLEITF